MSETTQLVDHEIELGFEYWTAEQILRAAMPPSITEITSSFETIGHIAHMNLRDKQLPYKTLIGQVGHLTVLWSSRALWAHGTLCTMAVLSLTVPLWPLGTPLFWYSLAVQVIFQKNKGIRTVVNKMTGIDQKFRFVLVAARASPTPPAAAALSNPLPPLLGDRSCRPQVQKIRCAPFIDPAYLCGLPSLPRRFFKMEVIAGDDDFETTVRESGCVFKMQYNQVYWNSRLHTEHDRIIQKLKKVPDPTITVNNVNILGLVHCGDCS